ncbi:MAG: GNAT family N-acetyltransferase [Chlamydiales bacterium]
MQALFYHHLSDYFCYSFQNKAQDLIDTPQYTRWFSGLPMFNMNGIFLKDPGIHWEPLFAKNIAFFEKEGLPHWWILPCQGKMGQYLEENGYKSMRYLSLITLDITARAIAPFAHPRVRVERVRNDEQLWIWSEIVGKVFAPSIQGVPLFFYEAYKHCGYDDQSPFYHYLGYLDSVPVGTSSLFFSQESKNDPVLGGLWNAGVLPQARNQGVGTTMYQKRVHDAMAKNVSQLSSLLMPDGMAWSYCSPSGFEEAYRLYPYISS